MTNEPHPTAFDPQVDPTDVTRFAETVFGYLDGHVAVRVLPEKGMPPGKPWAFSLAADAGLATELGGQAERAAAAGRAIYVVPGTTAQTRTARKEDVLQTAVVLVDLDSGRISAMQEHLVTHLGEPTLTVASGGVTADGEAKLHLYWKLTERAEGADLATVVALRSDVARKVGGDPSFATIHQPIRVPGSIHGKHGVKSAVRILKATSVEHDLAELAERVDAMPVFADAMAAFRIDTGRDFGAGRPSAKDLSKTPIHEGGADEVTRFVALSKVIGHWVRLARLGRASLDEAWKAVVDHNEALIVPPWPDDRLLQDFKRLLARDREAYPAAWAAHDRNADAGGPAGCGASHHCDDDRTEEAEEDRSEQVSEPPESAAPELSDDALAQDFVAGHRANWAHVALWGKWMRWKATHWAEDETRAVRQVIRLTCRDAAQRQDKPHEGRRIASAKTIAAVERILASDPRLAQPTSAWDIDQMLFNCAGGLVDLESGEIAAHRRDALITRVSPAKIGNACPLWLEFIACITGGDTELAAYLQRVAGYCLTGSTREQVFFFLYGTGSNGKSVFIDTLALVMGGYAMTAAHDTFMATKGDRHSTELAGLRGARLVSVTETESGRSWAETRIKTITGGDTIRARYCHKDDFEFRPTFKLMIAGNHRPGLQSVGKAMRRRLHLIPFEITIPDDQCDRLLDRKLAAEIDGILGWMLEGCAAWQRRGLAPPGVVLAAGAEYFEDEDVTGAWIAEQCVTGPEYKSPAVALFASWKAFAEAGGLACGSQKALGDALRERGFRPGIVGRARGWSGIAVRGCGDAA